MDVPSRKQPRKIYNIVRIARSESCDNSKSFTICPNCFGMPVYPIATDRKAAPTIIKLIMQEVFTAPIKLSIKLLKLRDFEDQASISAPITPMVAASVGVA